MIVRVGYISSLEALSLSASRSCLLHSRTAAFLPYIVAEPMLASIVGWTPSFNNASLHQRPARIALQRGIPSTRAPIDALFHQRLPRRRRYRGIALVAAHKYVIDFWAYKEMPDGTNLPFGTSIQRTDGIFLPSSSANAIRLKHDLPLDQVLTHIATYIVASPRRPRFSQNSTFAVA